MQTSRFPGYSDLRLDFADWGADLVLSGHHHGYERFEVNGLPYIVNGCGGASLDTGQVEPSPNENDTYLKYGPIYKFGACKMTVTEDELKVEFIDVDEVLYDTLTLEHL